jgi:Holliday junction resolvasome RuvABC DNA-binding subunit
MAPHVGEQAQLIREARAALTTAGYRAHEARIAVETARSHVGDQVTLAQLIREALRCCRLPGGS